MCIYIKIKILKNYNKTLCSRDHYEMVQQLDEISKTRKNVQNNIIEP